MFASGHSLPPSCDAVLIRRGVLEAVRSPRVFAGILALRITTGAAPPGALCSGNTGKPCAAYQRAALAMPQLPPSTGDLAFPCMLSPRLLFTAAGPRRQPCCNVFRLIADG